MSALAVAVLGALVGFGAPPPRNAVRGVICVAPLAGFEREGKELRVAGNAAHPASAPPAVKRYSLSIDGAVTELGDGHGGAQVAVPARTEGRHELVVRCNGKGCASVTFHFAADGQVLKLHPSTYGGAVSLEPARDGRCRWSEPPPPKRPADTPGSDVGARR